MGFDGLPEPVKNYLNNYRPTLMNNEQWAEWGPCVRAAVAAGGPEITDHVKKRASKVTGFALSLDDWGHEPPLAQHFTIANIERHIAGFEKPGTQSTLRSYLIDIGRVVNPAEPWRTQMATLGRPEGQMPYSQREVRSLGRAAEGAAPESHRQLFQVTLSLGLGAGLDGKTIPHVLQSNLIETDGGIVLHGVNDLPDITIRGQFDEWLRYWKGRTELRQPVVGPPSRVNNFMCRLRGDDNKLQVQPARLRATWIVHLIERDVPLRQILSLAGLSVPGSLDIYYKHVREASDTSEIQHRLNSIDEWLV